MKAEFKASGNQWGSECNSKLMNLQLDYMESLGFDRYYGLTQVQERRPPHP